MLNAEQIADFTTDLINAKHVIRISRTSFAFQNSTSPSCGLNFDLSILNRRPLNSSLGMANNGSAKRSRSKVEAEEKASIGPDEGEYHEDHGRGLQLTHM